METPGAMSGKAFMTSQPSEGPGFASLLFDRLKKVFREAAWLVGISAATMIGVLALYHPSSVQAAEVGQRQGSPTPSAGELLDQHIAEIVGKSDLPGPLAHPTLFKVPVGEHIRSIASRLEQEGIISDSQTFLVAAYYFKLQDKIKVGEYSIEARASVRDVLNMFDQGNPVDFSIAISSGLTSRQIVKMLRANTNLVGEIREIPPQAGPRHRRSPRNSPTRRGDLRTKNRRRVSETTDVFSDAALPHSRIA